eukprot:TRINITY_DN29794_c0_g1_i1.p1 TRINITY_DN29794_c0_g1~~TRINITY_DN29794_c0_g1_i1.p1  ORF type:complete len:281 (+),score=48.51 TRINITY_DN29794_c0_g1_i1:1268-2110(+)
MAQEDDDEIIAQVEDKLDVEVAAADLLEWKGKSPPPNPEPSSKPATAAGGRAARSTKRAGRGAVNEEGVEAVVPAPVRRKVVGRASSRAAETGKGGAGEVEQEEVRTERTEQSSGTESSRRRRGATQPVKQSETFTSIAAASTSRRRNLRAQVGKAGENGLPPAQRVEARAVSEVKGKRSLGRRIAKVDLNAENREGEREPTALATALNAMASTTSIGRVGGMNEAGLGVASAPHAFIKKGRVSEKAHDPSKTPSAGESVLRDGKAGLRGRRVKRQRSAT